MQATKQLSSAGQSIWLDNITRDLLSTGTLEQYIRDRSSLGLPPSLRAQVRCLSR
jgi:transaldolase